MKIKCIHDGVMCRKDNFYTIEYIQDGRIRINLGLGSMTMTLSKGSGWSYTEWFQELTEEDLLYLKLSGVYR